MDLGLTGARALVLGSSSGLGRAVSAGLAAEGAAVAVVSRDAQRAVEARDAIGAAAALSGDLTTPGEGARLVADAVAALGGLDICVVNTGGGKPGGILATGGVDDAAYHAMLRPALEVARAAAPHLSAGGRGRLVFLTARSVVEATPDLALSSVMRSGVAAAARSLALELAPDVLVKSSGAAREQVVALLERCGLPDDTADRHPHAFSGGQRQRIGIARALALQPDFIVADEPVSALDVSVRAQVVNLLQDLQREFGIAYLFIAHDLSVVRHISHRIAILYAGKLVELADSDTVYEAPRHPYTEALLSSVPIPDPPLQRARQRIVLQGEIPNPIDPPTGCRFQTRCPLVQDVCRRETPPLEEKAPGHWAACFVR